MAISLGWHIKTFHRHGFCQSHLLKMHGQLTLHFLLMSRIVVENNAQFAVA